MHPHKRTMKCNKYLNKSCYYGIIKERLDAHKDDVLKNLNDFTDLLFLTQTSKHANKKDINKEKNIELKYTHTHTNKY